MLKRIARSTSVLLAVKARPKNVRGNAQHTVADVLVRRAPAGLLPTYSQNVFTKASSKKEHVPIALSAGDMRSSICICYCNRVYIHTITLLHNDAMFM